MITVTAQQSRFHKEAIEGSALKEVVVKDLNISIGNREILSHAEFQLQIGKHYVLSGRNGIGKSTLLKAIASDQIPSIPSNLRVLLLGQTDTEDPSSLEPAISGLSLSETEPTVLQRVIQSDRPRERLLREERLLSTAATAIENTTAAGDGSASLVQAYRRVSHERLERKLWEARQIALRRSGARGARAKKVLVETEAEVAASEARLKEDVREVDPAKVAEEGEKAVAMLVDVQAQLEMMDASSAEAKARAVLLGLGFSVDSISQPVSRLSGGWNTRCSIACALCQPADLLLLDEPTNFLDLPSIIWLERYIQSLPPTVAVLVVTHDRAFADGVADELLVLRNLSLERFRGNLSSYELQRMKKYKYLSKMKDALDKQKKHIQSSIDANVKAAKRSGDDKKLKQAASRKKKLDERMGMEVSAKGGRFKLNRDLTGYHTANRAEIETPDFDPPVKLVLPTSPGDLRFPGALLSFEKVTFAYPGKRQPVILQDVDLTIHLGERVGIAGVNGSGKSTLVALAVAADAPAQKLVSGTISRHTRARIGLYTQQATGELDKLAAANPEATALTHLMEQSLLLGLNETEQDARAHLSGVGLVGRIASDVPLRLLSGGQKVRLALAKVLLVPPHLLILDEVTTHLDTDTIDALVGALRGYEGAILVVTHDRFFMRCVVEGESTKGIARTYRPDEDDEEEGGEESSEEDEGEKRLRTVYRLTRGKLSKLSGGMLQYEELAAKKTSKLGQT